jgi:hypothetical protein
MRKNVAFSILWQVSPTMKKYRRAVVMPFWPLAIVIRFSCRIDSHEQWRKWNYHPVVVSVKDLGNGIVLLANEASNASPSFSARKAGFTGPRRLGWLSSN